MLGAIFESEGWDQGDTLSFIYYNVKLKVPVGAWGVGAEFSSANVNFEQGWIDFYVNEQIPEGKRVADGECLQCYRVARFSLILGVGNQLPTKAERTEGRTKFVDVES